MQNFKVEVVSLCDIIKIAPSSLTPKYFYSDSSNHPAVPKRNALKPPDSTFVSSKKTSDKSRACKSDVKLPASKSGVKPQASKTGVKSQKKTKGQLETNENDARKKRKVMTEKENSKEVVLQQESEYEAMVRKKKEERIAFLATLNIGEAKEEFMKAVGWPKSVNKFKNVPTKNVPLYLRRQSLRLQKEEPVVQQNIDTTTHVEVLNKQQSPERRGPLAFDDVAFLEDKALSETFDKCLCSLSEGKYIEAEPTTSEKYENWFNSMEINPSLVAKVLFSKVYAIAVHPSPVKILISAGSAHGRIGFWDVEETNGDGLYLFEPHSEIVSCLAYNPDNHNELYSSSFDGTLRCGNLEKAVFDEVYFAPNHGGISSFDFMSSSSFIVSHRSGTIAIVDKRTDRNDEKQHRTHDCPIKTVSVHPLKKHYFIASGSNGIVSLWDVRLLKKSSLADMSHNKCVNSAYFSPVTGNSILTTSTTTRLSIFDSTMNTESLPLKTVIKHDNHTDQWLTSFRAIYLPNNDDLLVVGSMLKPRCIEIFNVSGSLVHNFHGEELNSISSINAFHPTRPILVGGNSSGRMCVFCDSS